MLSGLQVFKMLCQGFSVIATYIWTAHAANCTASENLREMTFSPHTKYQCTYVWYNAMVVVVQLWRPPTNHPHLL